jgi:colicin import membrane protein
MKPATAGAPYRVPPEPSRLRALALAAAVHAVLVGFLWFGIRWQSTEPVAVEAEVWDMQVQQAAPPPPEVAEPEPQPEPEPVPVPKVAPPPVEQPVAPKAPDIALEREKRKAEQLKKEAEQRELIEQKKRDDAKARDLAEKKKLEDDKKAKEADKKKADKLAADKKKADQLAKAKQAAAEQAKLDKLRDAEMKRLLGAAGSTGSAEKSTAPRSDASYQAALTAKIKSTTTYAGSTDVPGNPRAEFRIEQLPTGEIISVRKVKSSGVPSFDDAVEKGIIKSSPLPKKKDGTVERSVLIGFSMKDLD